jgi:lipopolysaccharide/colanic/teichoic acid biosynthesis glycosyltransferase
MSGASTEQAQVAVTAMAAPGVSVTASPPAVRDFPAAAAETDSSPEGRRARYGRLANRFAKRAFDIIASGALILMLIPLFALTAMAVILDSPGPIFFAVDRVGYRGRRMRMLKFRKMAHDAAGLPLTVGNDDRFTRVGRWLAKTKLDELPQLWQVLRGEMSLVGPRPEDPGFVARHRDDYNAILSVRPGITGFSQIAFAGESDILDGDNPLEHYVESILPQKVKLDCMYAEKRTIWLDLRVLFWTAAAVILRRQVAVHRSSGKMNLRQRRPAMPKPAEDGILEPAT